MSWLIVIGVVITLGGGRHRVAERNLSFRAPPQEIAAGPERAASHEIVTDHRAIRAPLRAPMIMDRGSNSYPDAPRLGEADHAVTPAGRP